MLEKAIKNVNGTTAFVPLTILKYFSPIYHKQNWPYDTYDFETQLISFSTYSVKNNQKVVYIVSRRSEHVAPAGELTKRCLPNIYLTDFKPNYKQCDVGDCERTWQFQWLRNKRPRRIREHAIVHESSVPQNILNTEQKTLLRKQSIERERDFRRTVCTNYNLQHLSSIDTEKSVGCATSISCNERRMHHFSITPYWV